MRLALLILLCLPSMVLADLPKLKVVGPSEAEPGQLVVLSVESDGTNFLWIPDASIGQILQCNPKTIGLATPRLGTHKLIVIASNDKGEMSFVTHAITIRTVTPTPDPSPNPPQQGDIDYAVFRTIGQKAVVKLNDPNTALQLKNALNRIYPSLLTMPSVDDAKLAVTKTIESVLMLRTGANKNTDWVGEWRVPLNTEHLKNKYTLQTYALAVKAMAEGLEVTNASECVDCQNQSTLMKQIILK